jgi:hypothetical protein
MDFRCQLSVLNDLILGFFLHIRDSWEIWDRIGPNPTLKSFELGVLEADQKWPTWGASRSIFGI